MKIKKRYLLCILALSVFCLTGCVEEEQKEITAPIDNVDSLLDKYGAGETSSSQVADNSSEQSSSTEFVDPDSDVVWNPTTTKPEIPTSSHQENVTTSSVTISTTTQEPTTKEQHTTAPISGSGITWTLENGTLTISGKGEMKDRPWSSQCSSITNIIIKSGITTIRKSAFQDCTNLTSITIPNTVTEIGYKAFYNCTNLSDITIPSSVSTIGAYSFYECDSIINLTIPEGVTSLGPYTFYSCKNLDSLTIPSSVTSIDETALEYSKPTIFGDPNSVAKSYALAHYLTFVTR